MPGAVLPARNTGIVGSTVARVERVERVTRPDPLNPAAIMVFSWAGELVDDSESPPWYVPRGGVVEIVRVSLLSAATADHTIEVRVNAAAIQQFTLSSGDLTSFNGAAISVPYGAYVTVKTITVTDSDMTVELRLR